MRARVKRRRMRVVGHFEIAATDPRKLSQAECCCDENDDGEPSWAERNGEILNVLASASWRALINLSHRCRSASQMTRLRRTFFCNWLCFRGFKFAEASQNNVAYRTV